MHRGLGEEAATATAPAPASNFTNITGGISSILAPLAQVGVSIYQTQQMAKLEKARMKAEAAAQNAMAAMPQQAPVIVQSNSGMLIGVVAGGAVLLGLLVFMLTRKSGSAGPAPFTASSSVAAESRTAAPAPATPRIKRIKRISRPKQSY